MISRKFLAPSTPSSQRPRRHSRYFVFSWRPLPFDLAQGGEFIEPRSLREAQFFWSLGHPKISNNFG